MLTHTRRKWEVVEPGAQRNTTTSANDAKLASIARNWLNARRCTQHLIKMRVFSQLHECPILVRMVLHSFQVSHIFLLSGCITVPDNACSNIRIWDSKSFNRNGSISNCLVSPSTPVPVGIDSGYGPNLSAPSPSVVSRSSRGLGVSPPFPSPPCVGVLSSTLSITSGSCSISNGAVLFTLSPFSSPLSSWSSYPWNPAAFGLWCQHCSHRRRHRCNDHSACNS